MSGGEKSKLGTPIYTTYEFELEDIMPKPFYCVYCNRQRTGLKDSPEERTVEHVIPRSIGGTWIINICRSCNQMAGQTCDNFLHQISWTYQWYASKTIENGIVILNDDSEVNARIHLQEVSIGNTTKHILHSCINRQTKREIPSHQVKQIVVKVGNPNDMVGMAPAVAKIALGTAYYLSNMEVYPRYSNKKTFTGLEFADLRKQFHKGIFTPGGIGRSNGAIITSLIPPEAKKLCLSFEKPAVRRHFVSTAVTTAGFEIIITLFSEYFWKVVIPQVSLRLPSLKGEVQLPKLQSLDTATAGNLMYADKKIVIHL